MVKCNNNICRYTTPSTWLTATNVEVGSPRSTNTLPLRSAIINQHCGRVTLRFRPNLQATYSVCARYTTAKRYEKQAANEMCSPRLCLAWDHYGLTGSFVLSNALRTKSDRKRARGIYERGCCLLLSMVEDNHILILICDFVWNANISYWACCYRRNGLRTSNKSWMACVWTVCLNIIANWIIFIELQTKQTNGTNKRFQHKPFPGKAINLIFLAQQTIDAIDSMWVKLYFTVCFAVT